MRAGPSSPDGFLLLHVWVEGEHPSPLRVRLTAVPELEGVEAVASEEDALECVREWLHNFVASNVSSSTGDQPEEIR